MYKRVMHTFFCSLFLFVGFKAHATKLTPEVENKVTQSSVIKAVSIDGFLDLFDEHDDLVIIDSRTVKDRSGGFVEGSISLPDTDTTPDALANVIPSKSSHVLFYCNGVKCGRSAIAVLIAEEAGYSNLYWFKGGWETWLQSGLPVAK